jgi:hypothetical protein
LDPGWKKLWSRINIPDPQPCNLQRIIELFTQKIVVKLSEIWVWDLGSGKNIFRIPEPGVKKAPDLGSGYETLPGSNN